MKKQQWEKVNWPFSDSVKTPTYILRVGASGAIYLRDEKDFPYCCDFGANSDRSHSGCFFHTPIDTLQKAKDCLLRNAGNIVKGVRIEIEKFKPVPGINKRFNFETRSGVDESIQINILTELTSERLLVVLKRLRRHVEPKELSGHNDEIDGYDEGTAGCKNTSCSWGFCSDSFALWPYPQDHIFPYDFLNDGRISPLNYQGYCPMQVKEDKYELSHQGCFYTCRFFQKRLNIPTIDEYLRIIDERIAEIERKINE